MNLITIMTVALLLSAFSVFCAPTPPLVDASDQRQLTEWVANYRPTVKQGEQTLIFDELDKKLAGKRLVLVGERHDLFSHHLNQFAVLNLLLKQSGQSLAVGMEWFQTPSQGALDRWSSGELDEVEFLLESQYLDRWGYDYRMMMPILHLAKQNGLDLVALNADVFVTRKVGQAGLDALSDAERATLPAELPPLPDAERAALKQIYDMHSEEGRDFENFLTVQRIWDVGMAEQIVAYLQSHPEKRMIVFAGDGHVGRGSGIAGEVSRLMPGLDYAVIRTDDVMLVSDGADYVLSAVEQTLPSVGRLGVWLDDGASGAYVRSVSDKSAASLAGIAAGDEIVSLNEQKTSGAASLKIALGRFAAGDTVTLGILRLGKETTPAKQVRVRLE